MVLGEENGMTSTGNSAWHSGQLSAGKEMPWRLRSYTKYVFIALDSSGSIVAWLSPLN